MLGCRPAAYLNVYGVREASCQWNSCIEILPHHKLRCICMCKTKKHFIFFFSVRGTTKSFYSIILFKYTCTHRHLLTHTPINTQTHTYRHQSGQVTSAWFLLQLLQLLAVVSLLTLSIQSYQGSHSWKFFLSGSLIAKRENSKVYKAIDTMWSNSPLGCLETIVTQCICLCACQMIVFYAHCTCPNVWITEVRQSLPDLVKSFVPFYVWLYNSMNGKLIKPAEGS